MKKNINIFLVTILLIMAFLNIGLEVINYKLLLLIPLLFLVIHFLYKMSDIIQNRNKKVKVFILFLLLFINTVIQIMMLKSYNVNSFFDIVIYEITLLFLGFTVKKKSNYKTCVFSLILGTLLIPIINLYSHLNIICLITLIFIYSLIFYNYDYPLGKRKLIRYVIIGICVCVLNNLSYLYVVLISLFLLTIARNIGIKNTVRIFLTIIVSYILTYYFMKNVDIMNIQNIISHSSNYSSLLNIMVMAIILYYALCSYDILLCNGYNNHNTNLNIFYNLCLIITMFIDHKNSVPFSNTSVLILITCISINCYNYCKKPIINYFDRYKKNNLKKVSVVIPNYNYARYIEQRIDSIMNQTYPIYELIILDDCSKDNSVEVISNKLEIIREKYPNVKFKFIKNSNNSGNVFKQWQKAFKESTGDYLWIAEADDLCSKYFLNSTMKGFGNPNVVLSYSESRIINENGKTISYDSRFYSDFFNNNHYKKSFYSKGIDEIKNVLFINNSIINASSVIFKKDKKINVDEYFKEAEKFRLCGDWYFYYKYLLNGYIYYNSDALNYHRMHQESVTINTNQILKIKEMEIIQKSIEKDIVLPNDKINYRNQYVEKLKAESGIKENVIKYDYTKCENVYHPSLKKRIKGILCKKKNGKVDIYKKNYKKINPKKKISVVIPNYNYEKFIIERIDSILKQTYPIYELIILDDCSTDKSVEVIKKKLDDINNKNIKFNLIVNKNNSGCVFKQWQKAFEESTGDYVWIAEADDSADPRFLENVMKAFEKDEDVIMSYSESKRIDEYNNVISLDCRDWMTVVSYEKWDKSYINDGIAELKESLCICNTIPNVSAVVFKKDEQVQMLENCKKFKISGDWYLYYQLLKKGKISYCSKSLNYFRKHSNSTSTVAKKELELEELLIIQSEIRNNIELSSKQISNQRRRYENILSESDDEVKNKMKKYIAKKIAWIIPFPIKGSGGIRTMIQNANYLVTIGYEVDIYVEEDNLTTDDELHSIINEYYGKCLCNTYIGIELRKEYDLVFATYSILTADYVSIMDVPKKAYFIQDFEPWFEAMGELYLQMERTYKYHLEGISIGNWLANKIHKEFNAPMHSFNFCADLNVYKKIDNIEKEDAVCFIYQPEKSRRCSNLGLKALQLVKYLRPNVKIYLYGSDTGDMSQYGFDNLGIMKIDKCNELYNKCKVGLCISASNPSRIPFEMMAAGLPVVDIYRENNLYDDPEGGVLLADSTPESIASAILKILDDNEIQNEMSKFGVEFMKNYPIEKGFEQFGKFVKDYLNDELDKSERHEKIYNLEPCEINKEVKDNMSFVIPMPVSKDKTNEYLKKAKKIKRKIRNTINEIVKKVFKVY